ncbi:MAG: GcvT family protein, partial [Alphaproteobacteria bacterium]
YVDPAMVTQAMAKGARDGGAEIYRHTRVTGTIRKRGGWEVVTDKGRIAAEIVVNAAGLWAKEVGRMAGLELPIVSMEHQYLVTETIPDVVAFGKEFPLLRDPDASFYLRPEGHGMLFGPYEPDGRPWAVDGVPPGFGQELLPPDMDRIERVVELAMRRVPVLREVGIKRTVNGAIPHTPDGGPLIGPVRGLGGYWLLCGFSVGIAQGGGAGKALAEWIVAGEPEFEMFEFDGRRFGAYATTDYTVDRAREVYRMMYTVSFPREERPAGRPMKTSPVYPRLKEQGAVFEARYGWERAAWFAPSGADARDVNSFRRSNWFPHVAAECRAVRERVGVLDLSAFSKFEISGSGALRFLDRLCANRPPRKVGGIVLAHMLTEKGRIECEGTLTRLARDRFYLVTAAVAHLHDLDWLETHRTRATAIEDVTLGWGTLVLAGPRAREVLGALTRADLSNKAFPWLTAREIEVAGTPVRALRINFVGELGWELHHPIEYQLALYEALMAAGASHGIANFGTRTMDSLRLEKGYRAWGSDFNVEVNPIEAGLERFVKMDGREFIGRRALEATEGRPLKWRSVILSVDAADADALANAPVYANGALVGIVSSGGYGHVVEKSIALAYVSPERAAPGAALEIDILGDRRRARVEPRPLWDPENLRPRA